MSTESAVHGYNEPTYSTREDNRRWLKALMLAEAELAMRQREEVLKLAREKYYTDEPCER